MNCSFKRVLTLLLVIFLMINILGCAGIKQKAEYYWEKLKYQFSNKQTGTREKAVQKYKETENQAKLILELTIITPTGANPRQ